MGQSSCIFCKAGILSLKSNKTGKKHIAHEMIKAVTGEPISALKNNVRKIINCAEDLNSSLKVIELHKQYNYLYPAVGIHPQNVDNSSTDDIANLEKIIRDEKVVAIGEIGLDYYWNKENKQIQKEMFEKQIALANACQLPIVIHTREAMEDTIKMLKEHPAQKKGIFHCCPMNRELIKEALKLGYSISFAGPVT